MTACSALRLVNRFQQTPSQRSASTLYASSTQSDSAISSYVTYYLGLYTELMQKGDSPAVVFASFPPEIAQQEDYQAWKMRYAFCTIVHSFKLRAREGHSDQVKDCEAFIQQSIQTTKQEAYLNWMAHFLDYLTRNSLEVAAGRNGQNRETILALRKTHELLRGFAADLPSVLPSQTDIQIVEDELTSVQSLVAHQALGSALQGDPFAQDCKEMTPSPLEQLKLFISLEASYGQISYATPCTPAALGAALASAQGTLSHSLQIPDPLTDPMVSVLVQALLTNQDLQLLCTDQKDVERIIGAYRSGNSKGTGRNLVVGIAELRRSPEAGSSSPNQLFIIKTLSEQEVARAPKGAALDSFADACAKEPVTQPAPRPTTAGTTRAIPSSSSPTATTTTPSPAIPKAATPS